MSMTGPGCPRWGYDGRVPFLADLPHLGEIPCTDCSPWSHPQDFPGEALRAQARAVRAQPSPEPAMAAWAERLLAYAELVDAERCGDCPACGAFDPEHRRPRGACPRCGACPPPRLEAGARRAIAERAAGVYPQGFWDGQEGARALPVVAEAVPALLAEAERLADHEARVAATRRTLVAEALEAADSARGLDPHELLGRYMLGYRDGLRRAEGALALSLDRPRGLEGGPGPRKEESDGKDE